MKERTRHLSNYMISAEPDLKLAQPNPSRIYECSSIDECLLIVPRSNIYLYIKCCVGVSILQINIIQSISIFLKSCFCDWILDRLKTIHRQIVTLDILQYNQNLILLSPLVKIAHVLCLPGGKSSTPWLCGFSSHVHVNLSKFYPRSYREQLDSKPKTQKLIGKIKIGKSIPQLRTPDCWPVICHFYNHLTRHGLDLAQFAGQLETRKFRKFSISDLI